MRIGKIGVVVIGLVPFNVYGECTPTPDCASIGYTETSCEGDSLKCPFDITKMMCMPCDSSFRYDCSGENITGGTGSACGGKYVSCECSEGSVFKDGACACDDSCTVGAIYYSDGTCSACVVSGKTPIGVVVKDNELVMSNGTENIQWGERNMDVDGLTNYPSSIDVLTDFNGKDNTAKIVAYFGENVDTSLHAGVFCYKYATEGTNAGDWYLPAVGELHNYVYDNRNKLSNTWENKLFWDIRLGTHFWSSSESSETDAYYIIPSNSTANRSLKYYEFSVTCFLAIN